MAPFAMSTTALVLVIVLPTVCFVCLVLVVSPLLVHRKLDSEEDEARTDLRGEDVLLSTRRANYFGTESKGAKQIRGNGVLVLTEKRLVFFMLMPKKVLSIPLEGVTRVETPKSFCRKTVFQKLLAVYFTTDEGAEDGMGFWVPDPDQWVTAVNDASRTKTPADPK